MRYVLIYGLIAGAITIAVITASIAVPSLGHFQSVWFGYLVMFAALSLIFVGVKRYRDVECGGVIGFWRAFGLGLAMAAIAGLVYVAGWEAYLATTDGNFMVDYSASMLADMRASGASAAEIAATEAQLAQAIEWYRQPLLRMLITFSEILPVCVVVPLVAALVLRNPRVLPARVNKRSGEETAQSVESSG